MIKFASSTKYTGQSLGTDSIETDGGGGPVGML